MVGLGPTNSGKSIFVKACQLSFGDYVGNFNAETGGITSKKMGKVF